MKQQNTQKPDIQKTKKTTTYNITTKHKHKHIEIHKQNKKKHIKNT